jgi:hypothetical protein
MIKYAMPPAKLRFPSFQRLPFVSKLPSYSPLAYIPNRLMSNLNVRMNLNSCSSLNWWKKCYDVYISDDINPWSFERLWPLIFYYEELF